MHIPPIPDPEYAGKTKRGNMADLLVQMGDFTGESLDALDELGVAEDTIVEHSQLGRRCTPSHAVERRGGRLQRLDLGVEDEGAQATLVGAGDSRWRTPGSSRFASHFRLIRSTPHKPTRADRGFGGGSRWVAQRGLAVVS